MRKRYRKRGLERKEWEGKRIEWERMNRVERKDWDIRRVILEEVE